jgi:hypothetical protein
MGEIPESTRFGRSGAYSFRISRLGASDSARRGEQNKEITVSSISQQNPVRVFVAHNFERADDYVRVFEYLESSHNFYYRNISDPDLPVAAPEKVKEELRRQIALAEIVIVPAGLYRTTRERETVDFILNCAKGLDKPVVVLETFGVKEKIPVQLEALSDEIIEWNEREIVDAIRRQARHEDTSRWDVVEFKLD